RLADRFGVSGIVLLPLDVGLHVSRRHQPHRMPKRLQFARPMMRCRAGLHTNEARRQFLEEREDVATLQLTAEDHLAIGVNAVHLKTRLGDVETDCLNCLHVWRGGLNSTHFHGTRVPVEEPPTASKADIVLPIRSRRRRAAGMTHVPRGPSALAALRLTTSSNFSGDCTGKLPAGSPLRMRSTLELERRKMSAVSGP